MVKINVELVSPENLVFSQDTEMVVIPGIEGDFGVLHNHAPMISTLRPGVVIVNDKGQKKQVFVSGGFVEVTGERCTILAKKAVDVTNANQMKIQKLIEETENDESTSAD